MKFNKVFLWISVFVLFCWGVANADENYGLPHAFYEVVCDTCCTGGYDQYGNCLEWHRGVDLMVGIGTPFYSIADNGVIYDYRTNADSYGGDGVPGKVLFVRYQKPNGHYFIVQYGHIQNVPSQYQVIGASVPKVGTFLGEIADYDPCRGGSGSCPHMHFGIWDSDADRPPSQWGYGLNMLSWTSPMRFISSNNIEVEFNVNGGGNNFGSKVGSVHIWDPDPSDGMFEDGFSQECYIQDYSGGNFQTSAIVFDAFAGARRACTVRSGFWTAWQQQGGPNGQLGMPITNEYSQGGSTVRQDFQKGYLYYDGSTVTSHPSNYMPGRTSSGWDHQYSYLFAHAYGRNGGAVTVGLPSSTVYPYGDYGYLRQDFSGGTFGNCCIMYDPNNGAGNELATNEAYLIRTGFYDHYQAHGGSALGCPTRDEYSSRDPENWNDPTEYPLQNFFDREAYENGEASQHYMIWKNGVASYHSAYTTAYVSQTPSGQFNMQQGTSRAFTVKFRNTGSNTWYNSSSHLDAYVELKSCDASGNTCESFLNYPYSTSLGWLNNISPCTMQEASVAPGDVATFTFTGKVATNATVGLHDVYFRVNHSVGGLMTDWGGMHFQVNVTAIPVYSCQYVSQSPAGQFNFGEGTTQLIYVKFKNTGNTTWRKSASSYPNDFVKLVSCNSSGAVVPSFFNKPYDDTQGWIDDENVCSFVETSVAPGGTGTFRFTARVQEGQSPGLYNVYFRVHHATGGLLSDWAGMHFQANVPKSYSTDFVSRSPTGTIAMSPGQTKTFTLKFKNTGNTTWRKSASSYPNDYVEIKSCDDDGVKCASFLNWPYTTSLGWLNYESPCTFTEASVAPGGTATFTFTGKVASGTSAGTRYAYFRPHHSVNGGTLLPGWEGGYFVISVSGSGKVTAEGLPTEFALHQNYPNPFNPTTTISYSLPVPTHVRLDIFNILGQCVQTLVDEHQSAGEHSVLWTSSGFSSGIYLYRIQTGEATETRKMILLK